MKETAQKRYGLFYEQAHILVACHNPAVFCSDTNTGFLGTNSGRSGN